MKRLIALLLILLALCVWVPAEELADAQPTPDIEEIDDAEEWLFEEDEEAWEEEYEEGADLFEDILDEGDVWEDEEDAMEDLLMGAMEVYSWFVLYPLDVDYEKPNAAGDRYQVLDERFNTLEGLKDFVSTYFSQEIVDELFAMDLYVEEGGFLYASDEGRQMDEHIGETEFEIVSETEDRIEYSVTVSYWGNEENADPEEELYIYVRELTDEGWRFTQFPFFW